MAGNHRHSCSKNQPQLFLPKETFSALKIIPYFMKPFFLSLALAASVTTAVAQDVPTIYGSVIYATGWQDMANAPYGIYAIDGGNASQPRAVRINPSLFANGGGVYVDGLYHMVQHQTYADGLSIALRTYDVNNDWRLVREQYLDFSGCIASDLTYDPTTDNIYGCFGRGTVEGQKSYLLGILNEFTGEVDELGTLPEQMLALACNAQGELYGIGEYTGNLYRIDKATAQTTLVGSTGKNIKYEQSATFDYANGKLYWAATPHGTDNPVFLYEVSTADGSCKQLSEMTGRHEFTGLFTTSPFTPAAAPGRISNLTADFPNGTLSGNIRFTAPSTTFGGTALSGKLSYRLRIDGKEAATGSCEAGSTITVPATLTEGAHYVKVDVSNANGRCPVAVQDYWMGYDVPVVRNAQLTKGDDGRVTLTWTAAEGKHGGYVDSETMAYLVTRNPGNVQIYDGPATTCTELMAVSKYGAYTYTITPRYADAAGEAYTTAPIVLGSAVVPPYTEKFSDESSWTTFTVLDANNDGHTWYYDYGAASIAFSEKGNDTDDWLITPPLQLNPEWLYQFDFLAIGDISATERFSVYAGQQPTASAMTQQIQAQQQIDGGIEYAQSIRFIPQGTADQPTYLGIHAESEYYNSSLLSVSNLSVKALASIHAPAAPTDLQAVAAAGGVKEATLTFKAPTQAIDGAPLSTIDMVKVFRGNANVATFDEVQPGQELTLTDTPTLPGEYTYSLVAVNERGEGLAADVKVYVGEDTPGSPRNIRLTEVAPGRVQVTWEAPEVGTHGGYINPDNLKYEVTTSEGTSTTTTEKSHESTFSVPADKQTMIWFSLRARNNRGRGPVTPSDTLFLGDAYSMPFAESFARRTLNVSPWNMQAPEGAEWNVVSYGLYADPQDKDGGMVVFLNSVEGNVGHLVSPKITLEGKHPTLRFHVFHNPKTRNEVTAILRDGEGHKHELGHIVCKDLTGVTTDADHGAWVAYTYNLEDFLGHGAVQIDLQVEGHLSPEQNNTCYIDNISLFDWHDHNLQLTDLQSAQTEVKVGEVVQFTVTLRNNGSQTATDYKVLLLRDGQQVASLAGEPIPSDSVQTLLLTDRPNADAKESSVYTAQIVWDADEVADDNLFSPVTITVLPGLPYVSGVKANIVDGQCLLSWDAPYEAPAGDGTETVTEDFESYTAFTITNLGRWTLYDGDGRRVIGILDGGDFIEYPNVEGPMAYQVFNPSQIGLSGTWAPHSGKQVLAAFSCGRFAANDDWLISPEVTGGQTISFYAKSPDYNLYGTNEVIQVLYSTGSTETGEFQQIGSDIKVPGSWKQYQVELPADARRFAIRCISNDQYVLYLDDITYQRPVESLQLLGYHVYRDAERLTAEPISTTTYTDATLTDNDWHEYAVSTVYADGESALSPAVRVSITGISDTFLPTTPAFRLGRGYISLQPTTKEVTIADMAGRIHYRGHGGRRIALPAGVYLVNGQRVIVR